MLRSSNTKHLGVNKEPWERYDVISEKQVVLDPHIVEHVVWVIVHDELQHSDLHQPLIVELWLIPDDFQCTHFIFLIIIHP